MAGVSLKCGDCGALLKSVEEAQEHAELTSHSNFSESTEAVLNLVCSSCGKPCRSKTETDLHTKRTGHAEFVDKTLEAATPLSLEVTKQAAVESNDAGDASRNDQPEEMVVPEVDKKLLEELETMGFSIARATRALHFSGNSSLEAAVNWVVEHENDPEIDQLPLVPANSEVDTSKPSLTPEEMKLKAQELRERARKKKEEEEKRMEREREKERIRVGKELLEAKRIEEENERKRLMALRKAEKEEEKRAREKIRQKLEEDKAERRRKLGLPPEEPAAAKPATPAVEERKSMLPVRPATKAEQMRECLRSLKQNHKDDDAKVKRAFQTLLTYIGNVAKNPSEEKFRKIRVTNPTFQERVGAMTSGIDFLELCGFEKTDGNEFLFLPRDKVDMAVLNSAGKGRSRRGRRKSEMSKKVPDWLNSSVWISAPSQRDRTSELYSSTSSSPTTTTSRPPPPPPVTEPPVPVPPPTVARCEDPPRSSPTTAAPQIKHSKDPDGEEPDQPSDRTLSDEDVSRQSQLLAELSKKVVDMREVRRITAQGIPDGAGIRSTMWKLLLGYLPPDRSLWSSELIKKRSQYNNFKKELLINPSEVVRKLDDSASSGSDHSRSQSSGMLSRSDITCGEHPLSLGKASIWNRFFQETEVIEQIDRDIKRTHPDIHFFSGDTPEARSNQDSLKMILILFAKLNPGIRYIQGMNEILAPLFYVFKNDPDEDNVDFAEADAFFCFVEILSGFRDNFCQQLDNSVGGIRSTIAKLSELLKEHDEELWRHLEIITKVNPQFYAFRWITLLLTQEFNFADSLQIWDFLLSDAEGPQETLLRVCCAMLILVRRRLLAGDFTSNLRLLQNYPSTNISHVLYVANKLRQKVSG